MKIKTLPSFFNQEVAISNGRKIKFDHTGVVEVDDKLGSELIEKYSTFMFIDGVVIANEKEPVDEMNEGLVKRFNEEIYDLKQTIQEVKKAKQIVEADLKVWQVKILEVTKESDFYKNKCSEIEDVYSERIKSLELKISLMNSRSEALKQLCKDAEYPKEQWDALNKEQLIEYILGKG